MATAAIDALSEMWAAVEQARQNADIHVSYTRPANGFTTDEYADRYGLPRATARDQIARFVKAGTLERSAVMLPDSAGVMRRTWVYVAKGKQ